MRHFGAHLGGLRAVTEIVEDSRRLSPGCVGFRGQAVTGLGTVPRNLSVTACRCRFPALWWLASACPRHSSASASRPSGSVAAA